MRIQGDLLFRKAASIDGAGIGYHGLPGSGINGHVFGNSPAEVDDITNNHFLSNSIQ
jgi:hypothetical protein